MNKIELLQNLHNLNESEQFYKRYQEAKQNKKTFENYLRSLNVAEAVQAHYIIPEIAETMPPAMKDEYFFSAGDIGIRLQKHNCFTPEFRHFHTYFEAFYVYEGICRHEVSGQSRLLQMGDFVIIPPGTLHTISVQDTSIIIDMILSSEVIENVFKNPAYYKNNPLAEFFLRNIRYSSDNSFMLFHTGNDQELKDLILEMMLESVNRYQEYDVILYSQFAIFFAKLMRYYQSTIESATSSEVNSNLAYDIIAFIQENHNSITLDDIAAKYHYTPEYTSRFIRKITGKTFMELLTDSRIKHAVALLKSTSLSVSQISFQVGYENVENFIRVFKKHYHMTPNAYRKNASLSTYLP